MIKSYFLNNSDYTTAKIIFISLVVEFILLMIYKKLILLLAFCKMCIQNATK